MKNLKDIKLAIASESEKVRECLQEMLVKQGANVVLCDSLDMNFIHQLEQNVIADVILIDMDDSDEEDEEALDSLLERIDLPILFYENNFNNSCNPQDSAIFSVHEIRKLARKLADLVEDKFPDEKDNSTGLLSSEAAEDAKNKILIKEKIVSQLEDIKTVLSEKTSGSSSGIEKFFNVWVLGASIGGPEAVKSFLAKIPKDLPVAFVLAQHLGDGFVSLLANQLNEISYFKVKKGVDGDSLSHGEVVIVPVNCQMLVDQKGRIHIVQKSWEGHYKPSIDCVIKNVTSSFKERSGVIIFSGMGRDGFLACQEFSEKYKGLVWAQSSNTCVISSMPDSVREANIVTYSGSPEALALKITIQLMGKKNYVV